MHEKTKVFQFSIQPSLVDRVKDMGNGKFAAGLYFLLREFDRLQGSTTKLEAVVMAPKGSTAASRNTYEADPRVPMLPGETPQANKKRLVAYIDALPETKAAKYQSQIEHYLTNYYSQYGGVVDEDSTFIPYESTKDGVVIWKTPERIVDYTTKDKRDVWVEAGRIHAMGDKERNTVHYRNEEYHPKTAVTQTKQLTPEALLGYGFKRTPPDMSDDAIEGMNADWAEGGERYGQPPLREMEK